MESCLYDVYSPCCGDCFGCIKANNIDDTEDDFIFNYIREEKLIKKIEEE